MKASHAVLLFLALCSAASCLQVQQTNPLGSVLSLLDELTAKITKEGEVEAKAYAEYTEWCDDVSKNSEFAIGTATTQKDKLQAKIGELTSGVSVSESKIGELAASVATAEEELKNATLIREKEAAEFQASEAELVDVVDTLDRAMAILGREMAKNPASLAQVDSTHLAGALQALSAVLDAAAFPSSDQRKLIGLVQQQQSGEDEDSEFGAPAAATYKTHSGSILDILEDMKEKAEGQLADLRKAEVNGRHNFEMLKQSLEDQATADSKDLANEKSAKASSLEAKATAQGDLQVAEKELENSEKNLGTAQATCMQVAADHESTAAARQEELKAIAEAVKILRSSTEGASAQTYSLLQVRASSSLRGGGGLLSRLHTAADLAKSEVVTLVKQLAKKHHSPELAQLASRLAAVVRFGSSQGEEPFAKVKELIVDMIAKLEKEAGAEATEKAYCDEQMAKTEAKKSDLDEDVAKLTSKIDQATSRSAVLKEEVQELELQLAALAREQAEMDKLRMTEHSDFEVAKADLQLGLNGVRKALGVLREYYGAGSAAMLQDSSAPLSALMQQPAVPEIHSKAQGAGSNIVGILEVVESDFAKGLAKESTEEDDAQAEYEKITQENKITKTLKDQDVKYKSQELKSLASGLAEMKSDWSTENTELAAVLEYYAKIKDRCIAVPETYAERSRRREAEIQGLKQALSVLRDETAFVQHRKKPRHFRGSALN